MLQRRPGARNVFAFTYYGPKLDPVLLGRLKAKTHDSCIDSHDLRHSLIKTSSRKRATWVESVIKWWNKRQTSDDAKVRLHPMAFEDNIVTFTKACGETSEEHFIVMTIREQQTKNTGSTYEHWDCAGGSK